MSDRFQPIEMKQLTHWVFTELREKQSIFGIPKNLFFTPAKNDVIRTSLYGQDLDTPFGVAAGPQTQMAQNIIAAWLCGGRFIELKTVQTLDEIEVSKPCIDMQDEGYNVEWSQELRIKQSFDEYLRAWVLIHALHRELGFTGDNPGTIFNISVGYNYDGVQNDNVQWFLDKMEEAGDLKDEYAALVAEYCPAINDIAIPSRMSDNVTLSTMHGCPPAEIGKIAAYFIEDRGIHTNVKLNPTLLGPEKLRDILNNVLGFKDIVVPDEAFGHDLKYPDALNLLNDLQKRADAKGVQFGVKLSNTLECQNHRDVFNPNEKMMYMSGRPLQGITVNLARKLADQYDGNLMMSYAGGADCFNVANLLASGMVTITTSSDLLKSGGYMRLIQYVENAQKTIQETGAANLDEFISKRSGDAGAAKKECVLKNLRAYAEEVLVDPMLKQYSFEREHTKTKRELGHFDCIAAPCAGDCPINQNIPRYMSAVRDGDFQKAIDIVRDDNPMPSVLGRACTHYCENVCVRTHYDQPLAIREMKRFIMDQEAKPHLRNQDEEQDVSVGIVGGGPCGLAAAYFLRQAGIKVTIFEAREYTGGMVQGTIPGYRATQASIDQDMEVIKALGAEIKYGQKAGRDFNLVDLKGQFDFVIVAAGAQKSMGLGLENQDAEGILDALDFLRNSRHNNAPKLGTKIGVIGGGDVAMDCARSAKRLSNGGDVSVIYRRTRAEMPAEKEEIEELLEEGIELLELAAPQALKLENGKLAALTCTRMQLGEPDDSGRRRPVPIEGSEFDIPLDNLIPAIGQKPDLGFTENLNLTMNRKGYIEVNADTLETSEEKIFAGGDAVGNGPETIVKAFGDGKLIAEEICKRTIGAAETVEEDVSVDYNELLTRRARREWRVDVPQRPADDRGGFDEILHTLSPEAAQKEAARCLECDRLCSLCATVCPNRAIQTYACKPMAVSLPTLNIDGSSASCGDMESFAVSQSYQILIQTDFCNECGNCRSFCPTAGAPYKDKPRFYLQDAEFAAEESNAFMLTENGIRAKYDGNVYELTTADSKLKASFCGISCTIDPDKDMAVADIKVTDASQCSGTVSLLSLAEMYFLMKSVTESLAYLPKAN